jgi:hypothetical protein
LALDKLLIIILWGIVGYMKIILYFYR